MTPETAVQLPVYDGIEGGFWIHDWSDSLGLKNDGSAAVEPDTISWPTAIPPPDYSSKFKSTISVTYKL